MSGVHSGGRLEELPPPSKGLGMLTVPPTAFSNPKKYLIRE